MQDYGKDDIKPTDVTKYREEDQSKADTYQGQIDKYQQQNDKLNSDRQKVLADKRGVETYKLDYIDKQISANQNKMNTAQNELDKLQKVTYTEYSFEKKTDPRVQQAIDKYGADSQQVKDIQEGIKQNQIDTLNMQENVSTNFMKALDKYSRGDLSYTPEQEAQVEKLLGPMRQVIQNNARDLLAINDESDASLTDHLNKIKAAIDQTGMDTLSAFQAADLQVRTNGQNMLDVLQNAITSQENKAKFAFDLASEKIDLQTRQQAALLGLPPGSQAEKVQAAKAKYDALTNIRLSLAEQQTANELNITKDTNDNLNKIAFGKIDFAASQGGKYESVAQAGLNLAQDYYNKKAAITSDKNNAIFSLEGQKSNQIYNLAYGGIPGVLQASASGLNFQNGQNAAEAGLNMSLLNPAATQLATARQFQLANNTSTTKSTPSAFSSFTDFLGTAQGVASTALTAGSVGGFRPTPTFNLYPKG